MSAAPAFAKLKVLHFEVTGGPLRGKTFNLSKPVVTIGRSTDNDICLENDLKISRNHVQIRQVNGAISIQNMNEKNTMMVNGQIVSFFPMNASECLLRIGESEFRIRFEGALPMQKPLYVPSAGPAMPPPPLQPPMRSAPAFQYGNSVSSGNNQSKIIFYGILGFVLVLGFWLMKGQSTKKIAEELRKSDDIESDISSSKESVKKLEADLKKSGKDSQSYMSAQQYYIKGFRDYQQGQYGRAILNFQTVLAFQPQHELARKYAGLARRKLDEYVKIEMMTGLKYKSQGNYRMCLASYKKAIGYMLDEKDPSYQEATQYLRECDLLQREKF